MFDFLFRHLLYGASPLTQLVTGGFLLGICAIALLWGRAADLRQEETIVLIPFVLAGLFGVSSRLKAPSVCSVALPSGGQTDTERTEHPSSAQLPRERPFAHLLVSARKESIKMTLTSLKTLIEGNTDPSNVELREWLLEAVQETVYLEAELDELKRKVSDMQNEISRF